MSPEHKLFKHCVRYIFTTSFFKSEKGFLFHFKSSFCSRENQILEFSIFKFHDVIKCLSINKTYILLNNLGSKHSLLIKFGQFSSYSLRNNFIKNFYKNCGLKTSPRPFCVCKELNLYLKIEFLKQSTYIRYAIAKLSKLVQISMVPGGRFLFTEDSLKNIKDLELVSRPRFS